MADTLKIYHGLIDRTLTMLISDIDNCLDGLWGKKTGGDFYWQQIYHSFASIPFFLKGKPSPPKQPLEDIAADLRGGFTGHSPEKRLVKRFGKDVIHYVDAYFKTLSPDILDVKISFMGNMLRLSEILMMCCTHLSYHLGVCDAALRDAGAKPAM